MKKGKSTLVKVFIVILFLNLASLTFGKNIAPEMAMVEVKTGYVTATKYLEMSKQNKLIYVMGFF